ncbi:SanA/YdcF family protein [Candidatus Electrothrix sp.]|uniref:SanA/YdcF family protein n=1 Tax=Candidatus Electrothrix sp. TaxID=2170559 RepID=UPI0040571127
MKKKKRQRVCIFVFLLAVAAILVPNIIISSYGRYCFDRLEKTPPAYCAILLGTSKYLRGGNRNFYYKYRIEAAVKLYASGKCRKIIVSGDNGTKYYNEPKAMKEDLIKAGVRKVDIISDYAGFRTLDSIIRFKKIFGQQRGIVVSQKFHNERAVYIGRAYGIELYGYNALDVGIRSGLKTRFREILSRVMCVLDVKLLHTRPRFLGKEITI